MNRLWLLLVFVLLGIGILVFVYYQNQRLSQEWERMKSAAVSEAPVQAALPQKQTATPPRVKEEPKKIYDFLVDGRALVQ